MPIFTKKKVDLLYKLPLFVISLVILVISIFIFLSSYQTKHTRTYSEISTIQIEKMNTIQLEDYFTNLSKAKGAQYAFKVLEKASLPKITDVHLLGHLIGDQLYKQKGANGMKDCTDAIRNACSHSIITNLFYERGEDSITQISDICKDAPGQENAYPLCFHGFGHGVLAYTDYNLDRTINLCKQAAITDPSNGEFPECIGGAIMELISGGDHDKKIWYKQRQITLKEADPLYPCFSIISDPDARRMCLSYITPYLFEVSGKSSFIPSNEVIQNSFKYCEGIPLSDFKNRQACFGGFGKEFTPLSKNKDIRRIDTLSSEEINQIYSWCLLTPVTDGQEACVFSSLRSIYWSGTVDKKYVIEFCNRAPTESLKEYCFKESINSIKAAKKSFIYNHDFCSKLAVKYRNNCFQKLISNPIQNYLLSYLTMLFNHNTPQT